ncbi:creatininase family protein [Piscinibacter sp. XHJ-5]|uniref:creatininase family protein n=1 Tax=Piscinibacter sp. XHJ-5 TaxID=3037797 RepID=UPI002452E750|nr:creatininase family protein [Piscinibacter sp. XHJ-5]
MRFLVLLLVLYLPLAHGEPPSVYLEDLTWTEVRDLLKSGTTTVIVPVGGTEQNGPAVALGKHNVRVRVLAGRIASGLGQALVAPVIAYVPEGAVHPPTGHMRFAGTLTIPDAAFDSTVEYAARSLRQHGFRHIVLIGDHGGYQSNLKRVADKLNREWTADTARVHAVDDYYRAFDADYTRLLKDKGYSDDEIGRHAGVADTSLAMAVDSRLVRQDRLASRPKPADGANGDPARSSAELGQLGADLIVGRTIAAIRREQSRR